ncbi:response regulator [Pseudomonas sp. SWRI74]|jgi:FixJ family two-component response regulator|uniref:Response regulator protein TmoT n=3 Tax=Pseudomonas TaxID=286 RepID=A0A5E7B581_PSEFL|nr:response regulator [Pseudomonas azerbaijanoccidentalis]MBV4523391.1 response regulator [Pseudomonas azerbaijanoccidentalis]MCK8668548.1 response regulator [Pseudomonas azerbaijanoccidentalis]VVN81193.1 Response regulator protein TmoT [Pseudomonas fluorescens]
MCSKAMIAVVDNDESVRMALDSLLRSSGYTVRTYAGAHEFLFSDGPLLTSCLISDIQMPDMDGITLYEELADKGIHLPVIFITGNPYAQRPPGRCARKPIAFFPKPFSSEKLLACIETVLNQRN